MFDRFHLRWYMCEHKSEMTTNNLIERFCNKYFQKNPKKNKDECLKQLTHLYLNEHKLEEIVRKLWLNELRKLFVYVGFHLLLLFRLFLSVISWKFFICITISSNKSSISIICVTWHICFCNGIAFRKSKICLHWIILKNCIWAIMRLNV